MKSKEIVLYGKVLGALDQNKAEAVLTGAPRKPHQIINILLEGISDEEFTKLMFVDRVKIVIDEEQLKSQGEKKKHTLDEKG